MSLSSIRARVEKATEGPWKEGNHNWGIWAPISNLILMIDTKNPDHRGNSNFITHARADIPLLLKVAEAVLRAQKSNPWGLRNADFTELLAALAELEAGE